MELILEMLLTTVVAVLFSFLVAKLVSMAGNSGGGVHDQAEKAEILVGDGSVAVEEKLRFGLKMDTPVVHRERRLRVVDDENVKRVDRVGSEADRVVDEVEEAAKGQELVDPSDEFLATVTPENVIDEKLIVPGEDLQRDSAEEKVSEEREEEFIVRRTVEEAESTASVSPDNVIADEFLVRTVEESESTSSVSLAEDIMVRVQEEGSESTEGRSAGNVISEVVVAQAEEVRVEESIRVEESEHKMELNTEEKEEVSIEEEEEEDDDWEGIERSELEKAFATASTLLEESGKAEEISEEVKMELYGLHKIATEGSCRETQPMAIMVSARAKWNAWQKLGNMSQEEAMEQYLELISKEIPGLMNTVEKIPVLPSNSGSLEDSTNLGTTGVAFSKNAER